MAFALLGISILVGSAIYFEYARWSQIQLSRLLEGSRISQTSVGPIEYSWSGEREDVVLYIHGTPGGHDLAPHHFYDYQILAPSRPGYLRTPLASGRSPIEQADAFAALLDALDIRSVFVLGTSGGGPAAIAFAATHADRTRGLIALQAVSHPIDTSIRVPAFLQSDFLYWFVLGALSRFQSDEGLVAMQIKQPENRSRILADERKWKAFEAQLWSMWPVSRRQAGWENDMIQGRDFELPLELIEAPTLIIHGSADDAVPAEHAEWLAGRLKHSELHVIDGADHNMPITHEDEVDRIVQDFLIRYGSHE